MQASPICAKSRWYRVRFEYSHGERIERNIMQTENNEKEHPTTERVESKKGKQLANARKQNKKVENQHLKTTKSEKTESVE